MCKILASLYNSVHSYHDILDTLFCYNEKGDGTDSGHSNES